MFLAGVIFFLYRIKDVALYVTLFAIGHSTTLLLGVLAGIHANAYVVDAIIGLSVVYKAFENIGGFRRIGLQIDTRAAVLLFGLAHGFGLSTKLQDLALSEQGLVPNMIAFPSRPGDRSERERLATRTSQRNRPRACHFTSSRLLSRPSSSC